jgi:flagellar motor switch protein FliN/FliY
MSSSPTSSSSSDLSLPPALAGFSDVRLRVEVILGRGSMTLRTCLGLQRGSVVRLAQSAGQDLFVLVNDVPVARGEVVIIDDSVSLRLTEFRQKTATEALA